MNRDVNNEGRWLCDSVVTLKANFSSWNNTLAWRSVQSCLWRRLPPFLCRYLVLKLLVPKQWKKSLCKTLALFCYLTSSWQYSRLARVLFSYAAFDNGKLQQVDTEKLCGVISTSVVHPSEPHRNLCAPHCPMQTMCINIFSVAIAHWCNKKM